MKRHWIPGVAICLSLAVPALAGPPMICVEFECDGTTLPLGDEALQPKAGYDTRGLVKDTIRFLDEADSVVLRMETLRRAALYAARTKGADRELIDALAFRALDAEAGADTRAYADALYDAGYFAATMANYGKAIDGSPGKGQGIEGYAWIARAIDLAADDPAMHFGAALATHPVMRDSKRDLFERHVALAATGSDPVLAKNLQAHLTHFGESVDRIVERENAKSDRG